MHVSWSWLLPLLFASPWIAASAWLWWRSPDGGGVPLSTGEQVRRRLWTR